MENFFKYAKNELTQDSFLMWLFDNYKDIELNPLVRDLLEDFCGISKQEEILEIKSQSQFKKIDIKININTDKNNYVLYIEDKVFSDAGENQLEEYNKKIVAYEESRNRKIIKIFYKTSLISPQDKKALKEEKNKVDGWKYRDINAIYKIFSRYEYTNNLILSQYIEHISIIHKYANVETRPEKHDDKYDYLAWLSFFNKVVGKWELKTLNHFNVEVKKCGNGYHYVYIILQNKAGQPSLEIRSKECLNGTFTARLLFYGVEGKKKSDEDIKRTQKEILGNLANAGFEETKGDFEKPRNGRFKRELAVYTVGDVKTIDDFVEHLEICSAQFNKFLNIWEKK